MMSLWEAVGVALTGCGQVALNVTDLEGGGVLALLLVVISRR